MVLGLLIKFAQYIIHAREK